MTDFCFNFFVEENKIEDFDQKECSNDNLSILEPGIQIPITKEHIEKINIDILNTIPFDAIHFCWEPNSKKKDLENQILVITSPNQLQGKEMKTWEVLSLKRFNGSCIQEYISKNQMKSMNLNTDLISGVYEGGFKLWECAIDLVTMFIERSIQISPCTRVLDVGCGHGLPGIYCLSKGAKHVDFQDYNEEVLLYLTVPNIILNGLTHKHCKFFSGDWESLARTVTPPLKISSTNPLQLSSSSSKTVDTNTYLSNHEIIDTSLNQMDIQNDPSRPKELYDMILTADTLYSEGSHSKLLRYMKSRLSKNGVIYVASKSFYFGVGGSVHSFQLLVEQDPELEINCEKKIMDGKSNVRQILSIKFKQ